MRASHQHDIHVQSLLTPDHYSHATGIKPKRSRIHPGSMSGFTGKGNCLVLSWTAMVLYRAPVLRETISCARHISVALAGYVSSLIAAW
jgi:hypothetical protein